jgi:uridine kinase
MEIPRYDLKSGLEAAKKIIFDSKKPILVPISGLTCSGKTFLSKLLNLELGQMEIGSVLISQDNYFRDFDDPELPKNEKGVPIFDSLYSLHNDEFISDILRLLSGQPIYLPQYEKGPNWRIGKRILINPQPVIIVEGLYPLLLLSEVSPNILKIFIDTDPMICLQRRINRDSQDFKIIPEKNKKHILENVFPWFEREGRRQKDLADIIIENNEEV